MVDPVDIIRPYKMEGMQADTAAGAMEKVPNLVKTNQRPAKLPTMQPLLSP